MFYANFFRQPENYFSNEILVAGLGALAGGNFITTVLAILSCNVRRSRDVNSITAQISVGI